MRKVSKNGPEKLRIWTLFTPCKDDFIIPEWLFDERKVTIVQQPFSKSNVNFTKSLIKNLVIFTNNRFKLNVVWNTRNIRLLFQIKDNVQHYSCVVYKGNSSYSENYVSENVVNVVLRWDEHEDPNKQLEPTKHLKYFSDNQFEWKLLTRASEHTKKIKILEAFLIKSLNPSFNEQLLTELLVPFRNGNDHDHVINNNSQVFVFFFDIANKI